MTKWDDHQMTERVREVLEAVHLNNPEGHHFGRPFLSSYQIAIEIDRRHPELKDQLGKPVGGRGSGQHNSMAQYIGNELSKQIKADPLHHLFEGVFMSNDDAYSITYLRADGSELVSSLVGTEFDMALFRLRPFEPDAG